MAYQPPPPYPGAGQGQSYPPGNTTEKPIHHQGYPPQPGQAYPAATGYPPQPTGAYPPQPTPGHPAAQPGYPQPAYPPGYIQQPASYTAINNSTTVVVAAQQPTITAAVIPYVNDHMGLSIFSCLFCCWFIGCFAIMKSSEARSHFNAGHYTQALASARTAKHLSYGAIFSGIGVLALIIIINSAA